MLELHILGENPEKKLDQLISERVEAELKRRSFSIEAEIGKRVAEAKAEIEVRLRKEYDHKYRHEIDDYARKEVKICLEFILWKEKLILFLLIQFRDIGRGESEIHEPQN